MTAKIVDLPKCKSTDQMMETLAAATSHARAKEVIEIEIRMKTADGRTWSSDGKHIKDA